MIKPNGFPTVLVFDNDDMIREFAVEAVERLGYAAIPAANFHTAFRILTTNSSLCVLLTEVYLEIGFRSSPVRNLLAVRPELSVVFTSSGIRDFCFRRTDRVLEKPYRLDDLGTVLKTALTESRSSDERHIGLDRRRAKAG